MHKLQKIWFQEADELYRKNNRAGLSTTACNTKMSAERKEVLWLSNQFSSCNW